MKTSLSLSQLASRLESDKSGTADYIAPVTSLRMDPLAKLEIVGTTLSGLPLSNIGHASLAQYVDIPREYYNKTLAVAPALLAQNVNQWLPAIKNRDNKPDRRMIRTLHGNARAFLSDRYHRIDNHQVAEVTLNILSAMRGIKVVSCEVTDYRMYIKVTSTNIVAPDPGLRRVGSLIEAGVMISNSEIGAGAVSIKPYANFLFCLNGMVRDGAKVRAAHIGRRVDESLEGVLSDETKKLEDAVVLRKVRDVINHAFDEAAFKRFIDGLTNATQQPIEGDVVASVELLGQTLGIAPGERTSVLNHLIKEGDLSRYGMMNAITRTAEDVDSYDRATELESIGFQVIDIEKRQWERIANAAPLTGRGRRGEVVSVQ